MSECFSSFDDVFDLFVGLVFVDVDVVVVGGVGLGLGDLAVSFGKVDNASQDRRGGSRDRAYRWRATGGNGAALSVLFGFPVRRGCRRSGLHLRLGRGHQGCGGRRVGPSTAPSLHEFHSLASWRLSLKCLPNLKIETIMYKIKCIH